MRAGDVYYTKTSSKWLRPNEIVRVIQVSDNSVHYSYRSTKYMITYEIRISRFRDETEPTPKTMLKQKLRRLD